MKILKRSSSTENPVDTHYKGLDIDLEPLDKSDADFKVSSLETTIQYDLRNHKTALLRDRKTLG